MSKKVLAEVEKKISIETAERHDPKEYFKDRDGLYVFGNFEDRILSKAEVTEAKVKFDLTSYKLSEYATDEQIEAELPEKYLFSESEVCAIVADLISKQPKGEEGVLLNNGYANLFYMSAFVVGVLWGSGGWDVGTWGRDDYGWFADFRVFSPATVA